MAVSAGTAVLQVAPQLVKTFSRDIATQLAGPAQKAAAKTGQESGRAFGKRFGVSARTGLGPVTGIVRGFGGALAGAFAGVAVVSGLKATINAASDLQETLNKNRVVFGASAKSIEQWSKNSAQSFGLSRGAALAAAAQFGEMFHQLGFTQQQSAKTSKSLVQTAADLGSFHNVDPSDVLDRIGAALRGEYDSLQQLIPNINAARVEQEALRLSHKKSAKDLTAAEKATAVLAIVQKDGANAAGDFAKTSDNAANRQRILTARLQDQKAAIGNVLLPAYNAVLGFILDKLLPGLGRLGGFFKTVAGGVRALGKAFVDPDITSNGFAGVMERIGSAARVVWDTLQRLLVPAFRSIAESVAPAVKAFVSGLLPGLKSLWHVVQNQVFPAIKILAAVIGGALFVALKFLLPLLLRIAGPVLGFLFKQLAQTIQWISNVIRWIGNMGAAFLRWITGTKTTGAALVKLGQTAITQFRAIGNAVKVMWERVLRPTFAFLARAWLTTVGIIVRGAAIALGWVPGVGPKLKTAVTAFDRFAAGVNKALGDIDDEGVNVKLKSTFTPPKGFSMHSIVGAQKGLRLPGYGGGDRIPIMVEAGETVVPKDASRDRGFQAWAASKGIPGFQRGGYVDWGTVSAKKWSQLLAAGWRGDPTDRRERLYAPGYVGTTGRGLTLRASGLSPAEMARTQKGINREVGARVAAGIARNYRLLLSAGKPAVTAFIKSLDPLPYIWGGAGPRGYDCSGAVGAVHLAHLGKPHGHGQRIYTTSSIRSGTLGLKPGLGGVLDIGVTAGTGHMAGRYGGRNGLGFEAESTRTGIKVGPGASRPESFARKFHLARGGLIGEDLVALFARSGADIGGDPGKLRINGRVADNGAVLAPGMNLLENRTGRLEPLVPAGSGIDYDKLGRAVARALAEQPPRAYLDPNQARQGIKEAQRRGGVPRDKLIR